MIKKVLIVVAIAAIALIVSIALCTTAKSEAYIPSEPIQIVTPQYSEPKTLDELNVILTDCESRMSNAHVMADGARALGYENTDNIILEAKMHYNKAQSDYQEYYDKYFDKLNKDSFWEPKLQQYPVATYIWLYYKNLEYNDYVIAGIMGNIMAEVGGQSLSIQHTLYGNGYYGMCQWNKAYKEVWGKELEYQCSFLQRTIRYEFDTYGQAFRKGFNFEKFCELTNEKDAALAFAKCYERCASFSYKTRQNNASVALNYFTK